MNFSDMGVVTLGVTCEFVAKPDKLCRNVPEVAQTEMDCSERRRAQESAEGVLVRGRAIKCDSEKVRVKLNTTPLAIHLNRRCTREPDCTCQSQNNLGKELFCSMCKTSHRSFLPYR